MAYRQYAKTDARLPCKRNILRFGAVAVIVGIVLGVLLPEPVGSGLAANGPSLVLVALLCCYWRVGRLLALLLLALCHGQCSVQAVRSLQAELREPVPATLLARVDAVTGAEGRRQQLTITVLDAPSERRALQPGARLRLSWFDGPMLRVGEHWQLATKLRPVSGLRNPGGFDYRRWLLAQRILASGSIRSGVMVRGAPERGIAGIRERLGDHLLQQPRGALLLALLLGDRSRLSRSEMEVVRTTGTIHLLVVSGLHVSMIAGIGFVVGRWLGRGLVAVRCRGDGRWVGFGAAILFASGYVLLAGSALPAQRALLMTLLGGALLAGGRLHQAFDVWVSVLLLLLLADPLIALAAGTWLSFGAVAALVWFWAPRSKAGWLSTLLLSQGLLTAVSTVLLVQFGSPFGPAAPVANLLAVPVITLLVVPAALLGAVGWLLNLAQAHWLLDMAADALELLWIWLERWSDVQLWYAQRPHALGLFCVVAALLLGRRVTGRWTLGAVLAGLSVLLIATRGAPPASEFRVIVFDVGQGSAALVQTQRHDLLFDAAPAYPEGVDLGAAVVLPSLAQFGVRRLDGLVISHDDADHAGGAGALRSALPIAQLWRSHSDGRTAGDGIAASWSGGVRPRPCQRGQHWHWDGVRFEFLHPLNQADPERPAGGSRSKSGNEDSCMLRISTPRAAALLTGDTGRTSERELVRRGIAPVDMLTVPHHGSAGSSDRAFVRLLRPRVAIASAGRFNQYGHPRPDVQERYRRVGARFVVTANEGALLWRSEQASAVVSAEVRVLPDGRVER